MYLLEVMIQDNGKVSIDVDAELHEVVDQVRRAINEGFFSKKDNGKTIVYPISSIMPLTLEEQ